MAVLYLDSHKPSQKLILLARKIYMLPKILSIASELSIERRSRIFLLRVLALTTISLCRNGGATSEEAGHVCNVIRHPAFFSIVSCVIYDDIRKQCVVDAMVSPPPSD